MDQYKSAQQQKPQHPPALIWQRLQQRGCHSNRWRRSLSEAATKQHRFASGYGGVRCQMSLYYMSIWEYTLGKVEWVRVGAKHQAASSQWSAKADQFALPCVYADKSKYICMQVNKYVGMWSAAVCSDTRAPLHK